jgi:hypothetical protein
VSKKFRQALGKGFSGFGVLFNVKNVAHSQGFIKSISASSLASDAKGLRTDSAVIVKSLKGSQCTPKITDE